MVTLIASAGIAALFRMFSDLVRGMDFDVEVY
jgi:hypothetical protein